MRKTPLLAITLCLSACGLIPGTNANLEREARKYVIGTLRDPQSAQFRNLKVVDGSIDGRGEKLVCGEVNAKNAMGGFVGFQPFIYIAGRKAAAMSQGESATEIRERSIGPDHNWISDEAKARWEEQADMENWWGQNCAS